MTIFSFMSVGWGCIDGVEVELWGECYNIETTNSLSLSNQGLTGEIPSEIGNLTNLSILYLRDNQLTGVIPSSIGNFTNLISLRLDYNQLTGEIPQSVCNLIENNQLNFSRISKVELQKKLKFAINFFQLLFHIFL